MLLGTLVPSLLGNIVTGKGGLLLIVRGGYDHKGQGIVRAAYDFKNF